MVDPQTLVGLRDVLEIDCFRTVTQCSSLRVLLSLNEIPGLSKFVGLFRAVIPPRPRPTLVLYISSRRCPGRFGFQDIRRRGARKEVSTGSAKDRSEAPTAHLSSLHSLLLVLSLQHLQSAGRLTDEGESPAKSALRIYKSDRGIPSTNPKSKVSEYKACYHPSPITLLSASGCIPSGIQRGQLRWQATRVCVLQRLPLCLFRYIGGCGHPPSVTSYITTPPPPAKEFTY